MRIRNMFVVASISKQVGAIPVHFDFTEFDGLQPRPGAAYKDFLE